MMRSADPNPPGTPEAQERRRPHDFHVAVKEAAPRGTDASEGVLRVD